jgi:NAD(P)-dependent dehydrogenase (short-subunit alcohol dehydrogenase family)
MLNLKGKTAIITGAAQGIGYASALQFSNHGARVYAIDINKDSLTSLSRINKNIIPVLIDVTDFDKVLSFAKTLHSVDILLNCIGFVHHGTILDCEIKDWEKSFNINVTSMYFITKALLSIMIRNSMGASIINISSVASSIKGVKDRFVYSTTKAAIIGFSKSVAFDFVKNGIRCNVICPGTVDSPSLRGRIDELSKKCDRSDVYKNFVSRQPMKRFGTPDEIASLALYLASDCSKYTTGSVHVIDGGWSN